MVIVTWILNWINCRFNFHKVYSIADDCDFEFSEYEKVMLKNSVAENVVLFEELTALRCRHCDYLFMPNKDRKD